MRYHYPELTVPIFRTVFQIAEQLTVVKLPTEEGPGVISFYMNSFDRHGKFEAERQIFESIVTIIAYYIGVVKDSLAWYAIENKLKKKNVREESNWCDSIL
jgi:hypothetical protein